MSSRSIMGFDYGTKSIGVAIGQELTGSARPLRSLKANDGIPNWDEIEKLIKEWQPDLLIVGLPLNMDGTDQEITVRARKFGNRLHGRFGIQIDLHDERLSTVSAHAALRDAGRSQRSSRRIVDQVAAVVLLQQAVDVEKSTGNPTGALLPESQEPV